MAIFKNTEQSKLLNMVAMRDELEKGYSNKISEKLIEHEVQQNKKIEQISDRCEMIALDCLRIKSYLDSCNEDHDKQVKALRKEIKQTKVLLLVLMFIMTLGIYLK